MADLLSYALTTVADVKESLGIDSGDTSKDNLIKRKINQATEMIEGFCQLSYAHHFKETTYTNEVFDGTYSNTLSLRMRPVSDITSFQRRDTTVNQSSWSDVETDSYFEDLSSGVINLLFTTVSGWGGYRVSYVAGYSTIPADLAEACVILASYLVDNASTTGTAVKKKQEGARSIEFFDPNSSGGGGGSLIEQLGIDDMLAKYINYATLDK